MGQNSMQEASSKTEIYRDIVIGAITLIALYVTRLDSYHLFHSLAELFSIAVVGGLFAVTWASKGRFLSALFYRINVFGITVHPFVTGSKTFQCYWKRSCSGWRWSCACLISLMSIPHSQLRLRSMTGLVM